MGVGGVQERNLLQLAKEPKPNSIPFFPSGSLFDKGRNKTKKPSIVFSLLKLSFQSKEAEREKGTNRYPGKSRRGDIHSLTRSFIQTLDRINGSHDRTATAIRRAAGQGG